jgi:hypothetical protein
MIYVVGGLHGEIILFAFVNLEEEVVGVDLNFIEGVEVEECFD